MPNVNNDDEETLQFADESEYMQEPEDPGAPEENIEWGEPGELGKANEPTKDPSKLKSGRLPQVESFGPEFKTGANPGDCPQCAPFACDDPDNHLGLPSEYTPLRNRGCRCNADAGGWDCMCFEDV